MKLLLLIAATCVVGALCEEKCEPGTTFMEDCNRCRCGLDGQKSCTRKMCPPNELSDDSQVRTDVQNGDTLSSADEKDEMHVPTIGQVCNPNEIKMEECNRCRCANNGIGWFCTRRACPPREKRSAPAPNEKCTPGEVFRSADDCNTCFCTDSGIVACTRKACFTAPPQKTKRETPPRSDEKCTPGTSFMDEDGCNTCYCTENGEAACTLMACVSYSQDRSKRETPPRTDEQCTPGTVFKSKDGCNSCFCTETGMAACTMMACLPALPAFTQKTKRAAPPRPDEKCTPGTVFRSEDGCNSCFCTDTGVAACTLKACISGPPPKTKRDTLPQSDTAPGTPGFSCEPRSSFKYQCNTCRCSDDGKTAGCTFKYCIPGEW